MIDIAAKVYDTIFDMHAIRDGAIKAKKEDVLHDYCQEILQKEEGTIILTNYYGSHGTKLEGFSDAEIEPRIKIINDLIKLVSIELLEAQILINSIKSKDWIEEYIYFDNEIKDKGKSYIAFAYIGIVGNLNIGICANTISVLRKRYNYETYSYETVYPSENIDIERLNLEPTQRNQNSKDKGIIDIREYSYMCIFERNGKTKILKLVPINGRNWNKVIYLEKIFGLKIM